jgi:hypothetical protein
MCRRVFFELFPFHHQTVIMYVCVPFYFNPPEERRKEGRIDFFVLKGRKANGQSEVNFLPVIFKWR